MRLFILVIFYLLPINSTHAQSSSYKGLSVLHFDDGAGKKQLLDSIDTYLLLKETTFLTSYKRFIFIIKTEEGNWQFGRGLNFKSKRHHFVSETYIDWPVFEDFLNAFVSDNIKNQSEIALSLNYNGDSLRLKNDSFFSMVMDGVMYELEISIDGKVSELIYNNPHAYLALLERNGLPTVEHKLFTTFVDYLFEEFYNGKGN
ncbi:hypothetical protein [Chondrinema litorale]|uniref:hypothetical protein n=1 Tax=Chondrinema litorale TaxID=2994555 RepID=UPI002542D8A6|nr:hypothetical protein [Chondrinema litorale]UZR96182.1 hypothetical protein OQ292_10225 [Chondrinema litorale]